VSPICPRRRRSVRAYAGPKGVDWLYLDTNDDLHAAIAFYERNGYVRYSRYNDNPQATIFLRKKLVADEDKAR
jgi:ribosomal protein S18 acetylase RimI-like enzyme